MMNEKMQDLNKIHEPGIMYRLFTAPWIWAAMATGFFYWQIPNLPVGQELALRYFCGHPLERVLTGLFFIGLSIIGVKSFLLLFERYAFLKVPDFGINDVDQNLDAKVYKLQNRLTSASADLQNTHWGRRLEHLLTFFKGQKSGHGLNEHLTYLSESAGDRLHASHSLLQTVIWSIPILGFLGTVMGITLAIANVTPDQLETSLDEVTNGLAVAFDTTALALSLSLVLGFASLFIKRAEESLLGDIDERCRLEVNRCFSLDTGSQHPLAEAEAKASQALIEQTTSLISAQTEEWGRALTELREQWAVTIQGQQQSLVDALSDGTSNTLSNHAQQLSDYREQFLESQETITLSFVKEMQRMDEGRAKSEQELFNSVKELTETLNTNAVQSSKEQVAKLHQILDQFAERIESWQSTTGTWQASLHQLTAAVSKQSHSLLEHGSQLGKIVEQEESLIRLQSKLDQNLDSLHTAETFEQTLHNLMAAVNLLTARTRQRDAA